MGQHSADNGNSLSPQGQEPVKAFASLFRGRADVYGHLYDETDPKDPKYITEKEAVTLALYRNHLLGKRWLGIHPLVGDRCRFAATDLDEKDFPKALAIRNTLRELGLKAYIAETKHKGYRILVFFDEPQLARDIRLVLDVLRGYRVGFRSYTEPSIDTTTPHGEFIFNIMAAVAALERQTTSSR